MGILIIIWQIKQKKSPFLFLTFFTKRKNIVKIQLCKFQDGWIKNQNAIEIKELSFCHKSQQPNDANLSYLKLRLFNPPEFIVWNIYGLRYLVWKKLGFKIPSLWQRLNSFEKKTNANSPEMEFKEFEPRFKSAKTRFKLSAGLNLETFNTILSGINHI